MILVYKIFTIIYIFFARITLWTTTSEGIYKKEDDDIEESYKLVFFVNFCWTFYSTSPRIGDIFDIILCIKQVEYELFVLWNFVTTLNYAYTLLNLWLKI